LVGEGGTTWRCKDKTCIGDKVEIVMPVGEVLMSIDNQYGEIYFADGKWWLEIRKIISTNGKEFECIHSGDERDIVLPAKLPGYTILRRDIREAKAKKGLIASPRGHQRNTKKGEEKETR